VKKLQYILFFVCFSQIIFAQGPPITTETPVMLGLDGNGIRTFGKIIVKENTTIYVQPIGVPYNITSKFQVGGILPLKFVTPKNQKTFGGFADMTLFAKYQLYKKDETAKTFRILANLKQTFPTGKNSVSANIYQTYIGVILGKISTKAGFYTNFGYNITSNNVSDNFLYNFSVGIPLLPQKYPQKQLNTFLEFNGNYVFNPKIHNIFISPGIQFIPGRRFLLETSFQIPLVQKNISTNKTKYMMLFGARFLIN